jgi:SAM-dependent methyltransferase
LGGELGNRGFDRYLGIDVCPTADIVGDIREWHALGLQESSFDVTVAFELVEHVHCFPEMYSLLRPGGDLFLTSPVPHMDWACKTLEFLRLNQPRPARTTI